MNECHFICDTCGVNCKDEVGKHTHMLFTHDQYMQPCSTGIVLEQFKEQMEMKKTYKSLKRSLENTNNSIKKSHERIKKNKQLFLKWRHIRSILKQKGMVYIKDKLYDDYDETSDYINHMINNILSRIEKINTTLKINTKKIYTIEQNMDLLHKNAFSSGVILS